jgi:DNA-directed RNA polymerase specialized sigma24 family protein
MFGPPDFDIATSCTLMDGLRSPDPKLKQSSQERFYRVYAPIIATFARRNGAKIDDVEDITHTIVASFLNSSIQYQPKIGSFRAYLKTSTIHRLHVKASRERPVESLPESAETNHEWDKIWDFELLQAVVREVRERYEKHDALTFAAFWKYAMLEQPAEEVAAELRVKIDSVYAAKSRIQKAIADRLHAYEHCREAKE